MDTEDESIPGVCIFCCKQILNSKCSLNCRFLEFFSRFLGTDNALQFGDSKNDTILGLTLSICSDCSIVANSFCDLYHQLKCIELQLHGKIQTLTCVMKVASRVPSRVKDLKELFNRNTNANMQADYHRFMEIRNKIMIKCNKHRAKCFPRVNVERLQVTSTNTPEPSKSPVCKTETNENLDSRSFSNWIISLVAVFMLVVEPNALKSCRQNDIEMESPVENFIAISTPEHLINLDLDDSHVNVDVAGGTNAINLFHVPESSLESEIVSSENLTAPASIPDSEKVNKNDSDILNVSDSGGDDRDEILEPETVCVVEKQVECAFLKLEEVVPVVTTCQFEESGDSSTTEDEEDASGIGMYNYTELSNLYQVEDANNKNQREQQGISEVVKIEIVPEDDFRDNNKNISKSGISAKRKRKKTPNQFQCQNCSKVFIKKHYLSIHVRKTHPQSIGPFQCKLCNRRYPTYQHYLIHRTAIMHKQKLKFQNEVKGDGDIFRDDIIITPDLTEKPHKLIKRKIKPKHDSDSYLSLSEDEMDQPQKNYNLRSRRAIKHKLKEVTDSESSSSESSDISYSDEASSITSDEETKRERKSRTPKPNRKGQYWYCYKEGCRYSVESELVYQDHQKLHEPGEYKCMFCEVVEVNALKLSLHEERKHCKVKRKHGIYYCPRCPFQIQYKTRYINHFAQFHLGFKNSRGMPCSVCKVVIWQGNMARHFQMAHDTSKVTPESVLRCQEENCSAYFINVRGLVTHRREVHSEASGTNSLFQCMTCSIRFKSKLDLCKHRRLHRLKPSFLKSANTQSRCWRNYACPVSECVKVFREQEQLDDHLKLHGNFSCQFCTVTKTYAPEVPKHELEHNTEVESTNHYKCPRCSFGTHYRSVYISHHLEVHMGMTDKVIPCRICNQRFKHQFSLTAHTKDAHSVNKNESKKIKACGKCPAYFLKDIQLWHHQLAQHDYIFCQELTCDEKFKHIWQLKRHHKFHGSFKCQFCEVTKQYAPDLLVHELEHNTGLPANSQNIKCSRCLFTSNEKRTVMTHYLEIHLKLSDKKFLCTVCGEVFNNQSAGRSHHQNFHETKDMDSQNIKRCTQCSAYFRTEKQLGWHKDLVHIAKHVYLCSSKDCEETFTTELDLEDHSKLHAEFKCQFCEFKCNYAPELANHERVAHGPENNDKTIFQCSRCTYTTKDKTRYVNHFLNVHLGGVKSLVYRCKICQAPRNTKGDLTKHMKEFHESNGLDSEKLHECDECSANFVTAIKLINHKRKMHQAYQVSSFDCHFCEKSYKTRLSLLTHKRKFHDLDTTYKFVCSWPNCNKRFETRDELERHKVAVGRKHETGKLVIIEKKTCEKCGKICKGSGALKYHMRVHRESRPTEFKCDQCEKVFKLKAALQTHELFHKGPEHWQYICSMCPKKCISKATLRNHMRTHTKEKQHVCQVCGVKYAHRHNLRNHVNSKHKDEGVQDIPKKLARRFYVSRKGKKLGNEFCFLRNDKE